MQDPEHDRRGTVFAMTPMVDEITHADAVRQNLSSAYDPFALFGYTENRMIFSN